MTNEQRKMVEEIVEAEAKASAGPWTTEPENDLLRDMDGNYPTVYGDGGWADETVEANLLFCALARTAIPLLLQLVQDLEEHHLEHHRTEAGFRMRVHTLKQQRDEMEHLARRMAGVIASETGLCNPEVTGCHMEGTLFVHEGVCPVRPAQEFAQLQGRLQKIKQSEAG